MFQNDRRFGKLTWKLGDSNDTRAQQAYLRLFQVVQACFNAAAAPLRNVSEQIKLGGIQQFHAAYRQDERVRSGALILFSLLLHFCTDCCSPG